MKRVGGEIEPLFPEKTILKNLSLIRIKSFNLPQQTQYPNIKFAVDE